MTTPEQVKNLGQGELLDSISEFPELANHSWFRQEEGYVFSPGADLNLEVQLWFDDLPGHEPCWVLYDLCGGDMNWIDEFEPDDWASAVCAAEVCAQILVIDSQAEERDYNSPSPNDYDYESA